MNSGKDDLENGKENWEKDLDAVERIDIQELSRLYKRGELIASAVDESGNIEDAPDFRESIGEKLDGFFLWQFSDSYALSLLFRQKPHLDDWDYKSLKQAVSDAIKQEIRYLTPNLSLRALLLMECYSRVVDQLEDLVDSKNAYIKILQRQVHELETDSEE